MSGNAIATPAVNATLALLYAMFVGFVLLRIGVGALMLNMVMDYTAPEGSIVQKIHPAFYGIALVAVGLGSTQRIVLASRDLAILRAILIFVAGMICLLAMSAVNGKSTSVGYILDTYIAACLAMFVMMAMPDAWRARLGELIIFFLVLSAIVGIGEFLLKTRLQPYPYQEEFFRPTGLTDHPLQLGQWCATGICFVGLVHRPSLRFVVVAVLLIGALASGARMASLAACVSCVVFLIFEPLPARTKLDSLQRKMMLAILGLIGLIGAVAVMFAVGALSRLENGLVDQSSQMRVNIYRVFEFLSWREILFGGDLSYVQRVALDIFDMKTIESSLVIITVQFGLIGAIIFAFLLGNIIRALLKDRSPAIVIGALMYFGLSLTNNALSSKSADMVVLSLLIMADRGPYRRSAPQ